MQIQWWLLTILFSRSLPVLSCFFLSLLCFALFLFLSFFPLFIVCSHFLLLVRSICSPSIDCTDNAHAISMLSSLSDRTHQVYTGVVLLLSKNTFFAKQKQTSSSSSSTSVPTTTTLDSSSGSAEPDSNAETQQRSFQKKHKPHHSQHTPATSSPSSPSSEEAKQNKDQSEKGSESTNEGESKSESAELNENEVEILKFYEATDVTFANLSPMLIEAYVATGEPLYSLH